MFLRVDKLQAELPIPKAPNPNAGAALQELLGGKYGEMSTLNNYMFQSFNFRSKSKLRPFYSLVAAITAEELGHVELVSNGVAMLNNGPGDPTEGVDLSGAPFAYKTTNILVRGLFPSNHSLQDVFAADNPNRLVTDLDGTDHGTDIGLTSVDITIFELVDHQSRKHVDLFRVDGYCPTALRPDPVEGGLSPFALRFEVRGPLSQDVIEIDDAVFDRAIEPFEALFGFLDVLLKGTESIIDRLALCGLPVNEALQQLSEPIRCEQSLLEIADDDVVQGTCRNVPPFAHGLPLLVASRTRII